MVTAEPIKKKTSKKKIIIIVIIAVVVIAASVVTSLFLIKPSIYGTPKSENRLSKLGEVLESIMGPNWYYILITFSVILLVFMIFLYLITRKSITISDPASKWLRGTGLAIAIPLSLAIITIGIVLLVGHWKKKKKEQEALGDFRTKTKFQVIMEVIGLGIGVLAFIGIIIGIFIFFRHHKIQISEKAEPKKPKIGFWQKIKTALQPKKKFKSKPGKKEDISSMLLKPL